MNRQLEEKNEILNSLVIHDPLAGLFNRQYLKTKFTEMRSIQERMDVNVVMVMIDLNDFKQVHDTHGHEAGDCLLFDFANAAKMLTGEDFDFAFRIHV